MATRPTCWLIPSPSCRRPPCRRRPAGRRDWWRWGLRRSRSFLRRRRFPRAGSAAARCAPARGPRLPGLPCECELPSPGRCGSRCRPGSRWPRITFSFRPTRWSILPARAASVSTLVVSWKLAAEMKLELCTAALVMPSNCVLAVAGLGLAPLAGSPPRASIWALTCSRASLGTIVPGGEIAVALLGDLHALGQIPGWPRGTRTCPSRCRAAGRCRRRSRSRTLRSIWATMISMCLSSISTRWLR